MLLHPLSKLKPIALTTNRSNICNRRFLKPKQNKTPARATKGDSDRPSRPSDAALVEVVTCIVVDATVPDGVTVDG
jgi:hypothetical protein